MDWNESNNNNNYNLNNNNYNNNEGKPERKIIKLQNFHTQVESTDRLHLQANQV